MTVAEILSEISSSPWYANQIVKTVTIPARTAEYVDIPGDLSEPAQRFLARLGIQSLYSHQAQAISAGRAKKDVILATSTASGKTLSFVLPVLEALARDEDATALFLYPLKALTNDQLGVLKTAEEASGLELEPAVYDGDTPRIARPRIRQWSRIVLTNPFELHETLPYHHLWRRFFKNLKYVVVDEAHRYTGVFGSNVAQLFRRLVRVAAVYGAHPQFIMASASIANPGEHARRLVDRDVYVIDRDGAPSGPRTIAFFNGATDGTLSPHTQTKDLFATLVKLGQKTLCFTQSRKTAELIASLSMGRSALSVAPYRAGYLPDERRRLEAEFRDGTTMGMVSTNALELGIDVGDLDAVVVSGYPGTVSGFWQQVGRAGRRGGESLAVFVAFEDILDQYVLNHSEILMDRSYERATIDLENEHILAGHMLCASAELPLIVSQDQQPHRGIAEGLAKSGLIHDTEHGYVYGGHARPQEAVKLDRIGSGEIVLVNGDTDKILETLDYERALREAHPGAVYLHGAKTWLVESLDLVAKRAILRRKDVDYWTEALQERHVEIVETVRSGRTGFATVSLGRIRITHRVTGFRIKRYDRVIGGGPLEMPDRVFETAGLWIDLPGVATLDTVVDQLGAIHALEHTMVGLAPIVLSCDSNDMAGFSTMMAQHSGAPALFIFDVYEGGIGLSDRAYDDLARYLSTARDVLESCPCESGCPACCLSRRCSHDNRPMDKAGGALLAQKLISA